MKLRNRFIYIFSALILGVNVHAQELKNNFDIPVKKWNMKVVGVKNFYPTYLADPLGVRFEVSAQNMKYSDFDMEDEINSGGPYRGKLNITPGFRFSLFRFSPASNPKLGIEIDLGASTPIMMRAGNHDVIGMDGIYYIGIAGKPTEWLALRAIKHHICTHYGDEYQPTRVNSPIDFDPNYGQLPVRDDFFVSAAIKPLHFLHREEWNILQVYGDVGFFLPGVDFLGTRQNKPQQDAYMNYQGGAELEYYFRQKYLGGVFSAINISAYQSNAYSPNISIKWGYIVPQESGFKRLNVGLNYYNGRAISNHYYNRKEKWLAFFVFADF